MGSKKDSPQTVLFVCSVYSAPGSGWLMAQSNRSLSLPWVLVKTKVAPPLVSMANAENSHEIDGRTLINARAGWENERLGFMLWAKNLFDEDYEEHRMTWMGGTLIQQGEPRSFGLLMQYKW